MPHPRAFRFLSGGGFEMVPKEGEVSIAPVQDEKVAIASHYAYARSEIYGLHLKLSNLYFNYGRFEAGISQDIFDICVVRFMSFFVSDEIKIRLRASRIFSKDQMQYFGFLKDYRDKFLCHNNLWGLDIKAGVTFKADGSASEIVSLMSVGLWLDQTQVEQFSRMCLLVSDWLRYKDEELSRQVVEKINSGELHVDKSSAFVVETANLSPWHMKK